MDKPLDKHIIDTISDHIDNIDATLTALQDSLMNCAYNMEAVKVDRSPRGESDPGFLGVTPVESCKDILDNLSIQCLKEGEDITVPQRIVGIIYVGVKHKDQVLELVQKVNNAKKAFKAYVVSSIPILADRFLYTKAAKPFLISTSAYRTVLTAPLGTTSISCYWATQQRVNKPMNRDDVVEYLERLANEKVDIETGQLISHKDSKNRLLNKIPALGKDEEFIMSMRVKVHPVYSIMHMVEQDSDQAIYMNRDNGKKRKYMKATSPLIVFVETDQPIKFTSLVDFKKVNDVPDSYHPVYGAVYVRKIPPAKTKK